MNTLQLEAMDRNCELPEVIFATSPHPLAPTCTGVGGEHPAVFTMHCPAGSTNACVKHARGIETLFQRMFGLRIQATKAPEGSQCDNCVNEAKNSEATP